MTTCAIESCDRPVGDAMVCSTCGDALAAKLAAVPDLVEDLWNVIGRQSRYAEPNGSATGDARLLTNRYAGTLVGSLRNTLTTWVRVLVEERHAQPPRGRPVPLPRRSVSEALRTGPQRLSNRFLRCGYSDLPTVDCHHCREETTR